jgi:hypothetical protein
MPTGADFALVTDKKLLGVRDFDLWLLKYLRDYIGQGVKRLFIQGSFQERMPLSSSSPNFIDVELKPTYNDGFAHDGSGHILDLGVDDELREVAFANVSGQTYEVGASYVEYPVGIRTNPRTGRFEYDRMREGIGVQASPDSMTVDPSTLTFVVDALFEQGVTVGDHTNRAVRVFRLAPGDAASDESIAIETCTVFYDGQNKITTSGQLGQTAPSNDEDVYVVQLIGVTVLMNTATNAPSQLPQSVFFIGTVEGNGGTPDTFDITGQQVIEAQSADMITVDPLPDWFDSDNNPGGTLQDVLEKIITDLATVQTGDLSTAGSQKIASLALDDWFDGTTNPEDSVQAQLSKIVSDLGGVFNDGDIVGAQKISAGALANWADGTTNDFGSVQTVLAGIVAALVSVTGQRGAGKITAPALPDWADGTTNPAARVDEALAKVVTDLTSLVDAGGTAKIAGIEITGEPYTMGAGPLLIQLAGLLTGLNETAVYNERRTEFEALRNVNLVYTDAGGGSFRDIAAQHNGGDPNEFIEQMIAVGDGNTIARFSPGQNWLSVSPDAGFNSGFNSVAQGGSVFVIVGNSGEIQSGTGGTFTRRKNGGNSLRAVAYMGGTFCAVGDSGDIWTSPTGTTWTQRTGAAGTTAQNYVGIATDGSQFVVLVGNNTGQTAKVMTSPDGVTWTEQGSGASASNAWLQRQIQYDPRHGFVALRVSNSDVGVSRSDDGVNWLVYSVASNGPVISETSFKICLLDRQVAYLHSNGALYNAIVAEEVNQSPDVDIAGYQNIFHIADCVPGGIRNVKGTLHVFGQNAAGDAVILTSAPIRPNGIRGV